MMERRGFLGSIAGIVGGVGLAGDESASVPASPYLDPVVEAEDRRVRHAISHREGETREHWRVETLGGERVWEHDELVEYIRHSYASEYQVFVAFEPLDPVTSRRTVEHVLSDGVTRHREVRRDGYTRIFDVDEQSGDIIQRHP